MKVYVLFFAISLHACVACAGYPSLCERPPFGANSPKVTEIRTETDGEFEFHGVCLFDDGYVFSLLNRTSNRSYWLKFGETSDGMSVKRYDGKKHSIGVILPDGSDRNLQLNGDTFEPRTVQLAQSEYGGMSVSEEARRKFLDIVSEGKNDE
jgi:hypothetical protein